MLQYFFFFSYLANIVQRLSDGLCLNTICVFLQTTERKQIWAYKNKHLENSNKEAHRIWLVFQRERYILYSNWKQSTNFAEKFSRKKLLAPCVSTCKGDNEEHLQGFHYCPEKIFALFQRNFEDHFSISLTEYFCMYLLIEVFRL